MVGFKFRMGPATIRRSALYHAWDFDEIRRRNVIDLYELLRIFSHTLEAVRRERWKRVCEIATGQADLMQFCADVEDKLGRWLWTPESVPGFARV